MVPCKEITNLVVASLEHGNDLRDGPLVHTDGADTADLHAERSMLSAAIQTKHGTVPSCRPLRILFPTIYAAVISFQPFEHGETGGRKRTKDARAVASAAAAHLFNFGAGVFEKVHVSRWSCLLLLLLLLHDLHRLLFRVAGLLLRRWLRA